MLVVRGTCYTSIFHSLLVGMLRLYFLVVMESPNLFTSPSQSPTGVEFPVTKLFK